MGKTKNEDGETGSRRSRKTKSESLVNSTPKRSRYPRTDAAPGPLTPRRSLRLTLQDAEMGKNETFKRRPITYNWPRTVEAAKDPSVDPSGLNKWLFAIAIDLHPSLDIYLIQPSDHESEDDEQEEKEDDEKEADKGEEEEDRVECPNVTPPKRKGKGPVRPPKRKGRGLVRPPKRKGPGRPLKSQLKSKTKVPKAPAITRETRLCRRQNADRQVIDDQQAIIVVLDEVIRRRREAHGA